ncbi:MAG: GTPase family domain [Segetibacter sp.]|nr:GTPase family domain [Segetibacter sp.]
MGIPLFYSYSHKDERHREALETHLAILRRQGVVEEWSDRKIAPGSDWKDQINLNLQKAKIVLLLVSSNFLASDYCYETETIFALERHERKECVVIPVIVKPCSWKDAHFGHLQVLPKDGKPVTKWSDEDEAWLNIEQGVRRAMRDHSAIMEAKDYSQIKFGPAVRVDETAALDKLLLQFLSVYDRWYFSPLRIQKWGSRQKGFEVLSHYTTDDIRKELKDLLSDEVVKTTKSKKGNLLYKIA